MKKISILIFIIVLTGCHNYESAPESDEGNILTEEQIDSVLTDIKFEYEKPIIIDNSDVVLFPISTGLLEKRSVYSKEGYKGEEYPRYWNILFYNRVTEETRLLTDKKYRISDIHTSREMYDGESLDDTENILLKNKILYEISDHDYNGDGKLDSKDPNHLFISDKDGTDLIRISPSDENLRYFEVIPHTEQILIRTVRDTYRDSVFDEKDRCIWYKIDRNGDKWSANEVIDSIKRNEIEKLYFQQWIIQKKSMQTGQDTLRDSTDTATQPDADSETD